MNKGQWRVQRGRFAGLDTATTARGMAAIEEEEGESHNAAISGGRTAVRRAINLGNKGFLRAHSARARRREQAGAVVLAGPVSCSRSPRRGRSLRSRRMRSAGRTSTRRPVARIRRLRRNPGQSRSPFGLIHWFPEGSISETVSRCQTAKIGPRSGSGVPCPPVPGRHSNTACRPRPADAADRRGQDTGGPGHGRRRDAPLASVTGSSGPRPATRAASRPSRPGCGSCYRQSSPGSTYHR